MRDRTVSILHKLEYAGFRVAGAIVRTLPLEAASNLSGFLWRTFAPFLKRHPRAVANLPKTKVLPQLGANVRDILQAERLVIAEAALPRLVARITRDM